MINMYPKPVLSESFMGDVERDIKKQEKRFRKRIKKILKKLNKTTQI